MEEEKMLKQKYNDLLHSLYKGTEYLKDNPEDEKAQKRLDEIATEMQNIMNAFPNMTNEEREKGFVIEKEPEQDAKELKNAPNKKQDAPMQLTTQKENTLESFKSDWEIATQLAKSDIIPDNYKGKPQNVIIAVRVIKTNGITAIYCNAKPCNYQR